MLYKLNYSLFKIEQTTIDEYHNKVKFCFVLPFLGKIKPVKDIQNDKRLQIR
jgi:hypothetical protein